MGLDRRLSRLAHGLIHMSQNEGAATSESIAKMFDTNPVVVRRMMASLRKKDIVKSQKGHGGGWLLAKNLKDITLFDIFEALGNTNLVSISTAKEPPKCLVEQAVNEALEKSIQEAKALLYKRFKQISLANIAADFEAKLKNSSIDPSSAPNLQSKSL